MSKKIENLAKLIGECDNKELNDVVAIVKNHRKKLAHANKLNLRVGLEVWFGMHNGVIEKVNRTRCMCRDFATDKLWTVPITMIEVAK
jgi:hypothetical protein|tara:strand:+ start:92 stop:355 length:264 start_codon:yes stop_codon:yes gene_type:complete